MRIIRQLLTTPLGLLALLCLMQHDTKASSITFDDLDVLGVSYTTVDSYTELGFTQAGGQRTGFSLNSFMIFSGTATVTSLWAALRNRSSPPAGSGFQTLTPTSTNLAFVDFGPQGSPALVNPSTAIAVPEPTTMLLLGTGLAGIAARVGRRRRAREG